MSADDGSDNQRENPDPFLFSNYQFMSGQGKALVCQVEDNIFLSNSRKPSDLLMNVEKTYFEQRLEDVATQESKYANHVTFIIVLTQFTFLLVKCLFSKQEIFAYKTLLDIGQIVIMIVVLLFVAIPESLTLTFNITIAMSI
jgi:magnesium-transporting ATPase (P-type)